MDRYLSIACLQYTASKDELRTLKTIKRLIDKAVEAKAEFVTLPECATSLQKNSLKTKQLARSENESFSLSFLKEIAKSKSISWDSTTVYYKPRSQEEEEEGQSARGPTPL